MSQVISGLRLGPGFTILYGSVDPNSASAPSDVRGAALDYAYFRLGSGAGSTWLYRCSTGATIVNGVLVTAAVWTANT
jgi:hypothetical protein